MFRRPGVAPSQFFRRGIATLYIASPLLKDQYANHPLEQGNIPHAAGAMLRNGAGEITWDSKLSVLDPSKNCAYVGRYTNDYFGDVSVVEKNGGLAIVQGPKNKTFPMQHYDRDTFIYATEGENGVGRSGITFTIGPDGKAAQVVVENLNVHGEGTFKRVPAEK
jgi:hypothetical protein